MAAARKSEESELAQRASKRAAKGGHKTSARRRSPGAKIPAAVTTPASGLVTGTLAYSGDVRLPGMLHGRVVRPQGQSSLRNKHTPGGPYGTNYTLELLAGGGQKVRSVDESSIKHIARAQVVWVGNFVGVVAPNEWDAIQAAAELKVHWEEPSSPLPGNGNLEQALRAAEPGLPASTPIPGPVSPLLITEMGDVENGLAQAAKTVTGAAIGSSTR